MDITTYSTLQLRYPLPPLLPMDNSISGNVRRRSLDKHKKSSDDSVCNEQCSLSIPVQGALLCSECLVLVCLQCGVWGVWTPHCGVSICTFAHLHICWVSICTSVASVLSFGTHSHVGGDLYFYTWAPPIKVFTAELWSDMKRPKTPMGRPWVLSRFEFIGVSCLNVSAAVFLLQRPQILVFILSICARLDFWKVSKCETENKSFSGLVTLLATRSYTVPVSAWQLNRENCKSDFLPIFTTHLKVLHLMASFFLRYLRRMGGQVLHRVWNYKVPLREEIRWNICDQGRFSLLYVQNPTATLRIVLF